MFRPGEVVECIEGDDRWMGEAGERLETSQCYEVTDNDSGWVYVLINGKRHGGWYNRRFRKTDKIMMSSQLVLLLCK